MDAEKLMVYENKYFKLNKRYLVFVGLWPFSTTILTLIKQIVMAGLVLVGSLPSFFGIVKFCGTNRALCGENIGGFTIAFALFAKYTVNRFQQKKMQKVYEFVSTAWLSIKDSDEREIMEDVAKQGRAWTIAYCVYAFVGCLLFSQIPMVTPILDFIVPLNETRPKVLITRAEFGFDPYEHFYKLYFGYTAVFVAIGSIAPAIDTTYNVAVHQCIGVFQIVGHRVRQATRKSNEDKSYEIMISAIKLHNAALQFLKVIESAYNLCLLLLLGLTIIGCTGGLLAVLRSIHEPLNVFRFTTTAFAGFVHLLYITLPGQKVIDETEDLFRNLYFNEWYNMPRKQKVLLSIMMMRAAKPAVLTAGGMYIMNFENAGRVLKTIISYFTIAISIT